MSLLKIVVSLENELQKLIIFRRDNQDTIPDWMINSLVLDLSEIIDEIRKAEAK